jgi:hypothetical protein
MERDPQCEFGQGAGLPLPACALDESTGIMTITASNPAHPTGAFEGVQVLRASVALDTATGMTEQVGIAFFSGVVEGCGVGTVYFDYQGTGAFDADGMFVSGSDTHTIVPGGTLPLTGGYEWTGTENVENDNGTTTQDCDAAYSCGEA